MFEKILMANRGEIACRVIRTCRRLGIWTVAVYSEADAGARHVREADEAVCIGAAPAAQSYLDADAVIRAALQTGAQAIHPGYGFLSERLALVEACPRAGLAFVGPHAQAIASMGSKIESKRIARAAGVPCIPGYDGDDQSVQRLQEEAARIGFPLLIKASAGGGGKVMRRVERAEDVAAQLSTAQAEAQAAFGDARVLLERFIERPRHVEVQLLGDRHGHLVHVFERECSIQRNYQKLIEEAPAHHLAPAVRQRLFDAALALRCAIGYDSAGTVEFVLDADRGDEPYFLEVNTRLQVEHPVTELTTGLDLVEWQIRVAAGEPLGFAQGDIRQTGWAIEARVNAEDPAERFAPSFGPVTGYAEPEAEGLRIDSGIDAHSTTTPHYDSLLAKVIAHGASREVVRLRLVRGLQQLRVQGLRTTQPLLIDVLQHPAFQDTLVTGFLPTHWPAGWQPQPALVQEAQAVAVAAWQQAQAACDDRPMACLQAWRLTAPVDGPGRSHLVVGEGAQCANRVLRVTAEGARVEADATEEFEAAQWLLRRLPEGQWQAQGSGRVWHTRAQGHAMQVWHGGWSAQWPVGLRVAQSAAADAGGHSGDSVCADLPGVLSQLLVGVGEQVAEGAPVAVVEAMKLLHTLHAPRDGVVRALPQVLGATVPKGAVLVELAPAD